MIYVGINFPMDLDVKMKAVLLSACFLIVSIFTFSGLRISVTASYIFSYIFRISCTLKTSKTAITTNSTE